MKRGDFVKTQSGIGVIVAYHEYYDIHTKRTHRDIWYPWITVWIAGEIHYFKTRELKRVG
jgi:hypothetical protein